MRLGHLALALLAACGPRPRPAAISNAPTPPSPAPTAAEPRFDAVLAYLRSQVDSAFPGATIAVGYRGRVALLAAVGHYGIDDPRPVAPETMYDLASLTKVIGLTTACMMLVAEGKLELDAPVQRYVPAFTGAGKERITIRHLLTHSSGLPAWRPLYIEATTRAVALQLADTTPLAAEPGRVMVYSDLGAIVLTQAVEAITGERLDQFLDRRLFGPVGMTSTRFLPPPEWRDRIAPTERSQDGTIIRGTVHDENAWKLGGVSGHAGLFSTAGDLARFAQWLLDAREGRRRSAEGGADTASAALRRLSPSLVQEFTRRQGLPPGSSRALGWDTPSENSSAGSKLGPNAFGHTGFTGTSIWLDPDRDLFIILLTNRVHPTRENARIIRVRPRVADLVVDALGSSP
ncbi:MAG TPA: serine hydrolase domain-containing protein [Gemmatimonadales bacterium]|nr:serine hydrolase domain-containing protein [Gemmatimonadales bacterium]